MLDFEGNFRLKIKDDDYVHADYTHWKQTVFYLDEMLMVSKCTYIKGNIKVLDIVLKTNYKSNKVGTINQSKKYFMR